jgi:hypothetical protein
MTTAKGARDTMKPTNDTKHTEKREKPERGDGSIYRDKYRDQKTGDWKEVATWTIRYSVHGTRKKEGTGFTSCLAAKKLLDQRMAEIATGAYRPDVDRPPITMSNA